MIQLKKLAAAFTALAVGIAGMGFAPSLIQAKTPKAPSIEAEVTVAEESSVTLEITDGRFKVRRIAGVESSDESVAAAAPEDNSVVVTGVREGSAKVLTTVRARKGKKSKSFKLKTNVTVCAKENPTGAPDYSDEECWYSLPEITKEVDTFFIYPTKYMGYGEGDPDYAALDNEEMRKGVEDLDELYVSGIYGETTNLFIPYYRQASMRWEEQVWREKGDPHGSLSGTPLEDVSAALDYYFENCNEGRPFILAGHSQGSALCIMALEDYFLEHPEYYERMVAAYAIGFSVTKDDLERYPHLKFAAGETDTGVIISWNTEGQRNVDENAPNIVLKPNAVCINPLNWKTDDTYAAAGENLGSRIKDPETGELSIGDLGVDAQIAPERGVIVTKTDYPPISLTGLFGPASFHNSEYTFFYSNIKDNVAKRIAAYLGSAE